MPANAMAAHVSGVTLPQAVAANDGAEMMRSGIMPPTSVNAEMSMSDTRSVSGLSHTVYHAQHTAAAMTIASPVSDSPAVSCPDRPNTTKAMPSIDSATPA